ncbi:MAG: hypothetical protein J0I67_04825 [Bosea sp.]|nr:hypothetical protein [Bosea sp. (in: a-proteobacteria)]
MAKAGEHVESDLDALAALLWAVGEAPADAQAQDHLLSEISQLLWDASEPNQAVER